MSLSNADREQLGRWAETVHTASTWHTGQRAKVLATVAEQMREVAKGEVTVKELQAQEPPEHG